MYKRDKRLKDFFTLANEQKDSKYRDAIASHAFKRMAEIIAWLAAQVEENVLRGSIGQTDYSWIAAVILEGNLHYADLFKRLDLMPRDWDLQKPIEPLSFAVDRICDAIQGHRSQINDEPSVYKKLEEAILASLAAVLAQDRRYAAFEKWTKLHHLFWQSHTFFGSLLDAIPESSIRTHEPELMPKADHDNVAFGLTQADRRVDNSTYHQAYLAKMDKYRQASAALYIQKLTEGADYIMLDDDMRFKQSLVSRLGPEASLAWIDTVYWPLTQAVALHGYNDLDETEQMIALLVAKRDTLKSRFVHLLLIMLNHYLELVRRISFNLSNLRNEHHYYDTVVGNTIQAEGLRSYDDWISADMANSIARVVSVITGEITVPDEELQSGLFGWVTEQEREPWLQNTFREPLLLAVDKLHKYYLDIYTSGHWSKSALLAAIEPDLLDWKKFKVLYSVWQTETAEESLRKKLIEKMTAFICSEDFYWNQRYEFNDEYINQALYFTNLIHNESDALLTLSALAQKFRNWHEGWAYNGAAGVKVANRYIFLLTCGVCLSYIYYDIGDTLTARECLQTYDREITLQYRSTVSELNRAHYLLPIRLVVYTLLKFDFTDFENFIRGKSNQLDDVEDLIVLAHSTMESAIDLKQVLPASLRNEIWDAVETRYWLITVHLPHAKSVDPIFNHKKLYEAAKDWYAAR
jgi:hypothetical protein